MTALLPAEVVDGVTLRPFEPGDAVAFRELNEVWIEQHFRLEEKDRQTLGDPQRYILDKGGYIFMAVAEGETVGCCALLAVRPGVFEAAKMTTAVGARGRGIGRKMLAYTLAQAKALGAGSVYLETNDVLTAALRLYESLGFRHLPPERVTPSPYARANVFMELVF